MATALTHARSYAKDYLNYLYTVNGSKQKKLKAVHLGFIYNLYSLVVQSICSS